ncbi:TniQ family protein [Paracoccus sp. PARArs4]|uniref:TniQ family protein n=1 Tax=Paracoccus sp. PARArs4 TaxID=2853442 RepID=UPI0024A688E8|nr:TniQ family protein [Paracoccus sp. PARArs4]
MRVITPCVPYDPSETVQSYASRLSFFHTGQGSARLLQDCGVSLPGFAAGHPEELTTFATAVGEQIGLLQKGSVRALSSHNTFRGEDFSRSVLSSQVRQFCPQCLREDGPPVEWRHRIIWCFLPVPVCRRHHTSLVEVQQEKLSSIQDAVTSAGGLDAADASTCSVVVGRHASWLHGRLMSSSWSEWLDGQSIEQVLNAAEMLGAILVHGHSVRLGQLRRLERNTALERGFGVYEQGAEAVYAALGEIRDAASATAVHAGPLAIYGSLYDWLDRRSQLIDPGPVRDILRNHILNHDAYAPGERLLGKPVTERRLHSVISLSTTLKVNRRRMSRLLQKLGLVPPGATDGETGRLVFPVEEVEQLIRDYETAVPLAHLSDYIGCSHSQALSLYRAGILSPLIPANAPGAVRRIIFARRILDKLLERIAELPLPDDTLHEDVLSIAATCQRHGGRTDELTKAVLEGKVVAFRVRGDVRLHAVRVSTSSLLAARKQGAK